MTEGQQLVHASRR